HYYSAYIRQFISKSSYIDRSVFINNSELNVESLIKNLKIVIMKKLLILYMTESSVSLSALSVSFSAAFSQSSTPVSVSGSPAPATSVPATSGFVTSAFITSSSCFKEMLYKLNKSYCKSFSFSSFLSNTDFPVKDICVFRNRNMNIILFYTYRYEAHTS
ncbi:hypothetical protein BDDG_12425, partial [Blastomyces dermatitidis ATCC 18188]